MTATLQTTTDQATDWRSLSACATADPELHYELAELSELHEGEAKAICHSCPVKQKCEDEAMKTGEEYGIWGGKNPAERIASMPAWLAMKGLASVKPMPRQTGALHHDPGTNARYEDRLARARAARDALMLQGPGYALDLRPKYGVYSYEECMQALEMIISSPGAGSKVLAERIGKKPTRFNDVVRETCIAMGV